MLCLPEGTDFSLFTATSSVLCRQVCAQHTCDEWNEGVRPGYPFPLSAAPPPLTPRALPRAPRCFKTPSHQAFGTVNLLHEVILPKCSARPSIFPQLSFKGPLLRDASLLQKVPPPTSLDSINLLCLTVTSLLSLTRFLSSRRARTTCSGTTNAHPAPIPGPNTH